MSRRIWATTVRFFTFLILGVGLLALLPPKVYGPPSKALAFLVAHLLRFLGTPVRMESPVSFLIPLPKGGNTTFVFEPRCLGLHALLPFAAIVLALEGVRPLKRLIGLAGGMVAIWLANLARVVVSILLAVFYGLWVFDMIHDILWEGALSLFALGCGVAFAFWVWRGEEI